MNSLPEKSGFNSFYKVNFDLPGVYLYHCTPHGNMGMLGLVIVGNNFHNLKDIEKIHNVTHLIGDFLDEKNQTIISNFF